MRVAFPRGAKTPPTTSSGPKISRAAPSSMYAAGRPLVAAMIAHQAAAPSPSASSSIARTIVAGWTSPPPKVFGTSMFGRPAMIMPCTTLSGSRPAGPAS